MKKSIGIFAIILIGMSSTFAQQTGGVSYAAVTWSPDGEYLSYTRMEWEIRSLPQ